MKNIYHTVMKFHHTNENSTTRKKFIILTIFIYMRKVDKVLSVNLQFRPHIQITANLKRVNKNVEYR